MPASISDFTGWSIPFYWADKDQDLKTVIEGLAALFKAKVTTGTEPNDNLTSLELGDAGGHNDVRLHYDGTNILLQQNTGTEGTPVWTSRFVVGATTGAITGLGQLVLAAGLDLSGTNITNAGTINTLSLSAHASRHQPGGADAFTFATPSDVTTANTAGVATSFVRGDHQHRGVRSVNSAFGDITAVNSITAGTGITMTGTTTPTLSSDQRMYAYADATPGNISLTSTSIAVLGGFSNLAIPGADSAGDYIIEFTCSLTTATGAENTTFKIHQGTTGDETDAAIATVTIESLATGDTPTVHLRALAINPASTQKITVSYTSTTGSRHSTVGASTERPVLTISRMTGITTH